MAQNILKVEQRSFKYALEGLSYALKSQLNFKIQLIIGLITVLVAAVLGFSYYDWIILLILICLVLSAELTNTVLEKVTDIVQPEIHPEVKIAKDLAAGIVLLIAVFSVIIGILLFYPHITALFGSQLR